MAALPRTEVEIFHEFLASPLHNKSELLRKLARLIDVEMLQTGQSLNPEELYNRLSDGQVYKRAYFDKVLAHLLNELNEFLCWREYKRSTPRRPELLLRAYETRRLDEWIPSLYKNALKDSHGHLSGSSEGFLAELNLEDTYGRFQTRGPRKPDGRHLKQIHLKLQHHNFLRKLELATAIHNYNLAFKTDIALPDLQEVKTSMGRFGEGFPILLRLNYLAYRLLEEASGKWYMGLKQVLLQSDGQLDATALGPLYAVAMNFCTLKINQGEEEYRQELESIYQKLLDNAMLLSEEGRLIPAHFKNIVSLRLQLGEIDAATAFVTAFKDRLTEDYDGQALQFNLGMLCFYRQEHSDCIAKMEEVLSHLKGDLYYGLSARLWKLKAIFERNSLDDSYFLDSQLNAFRVYLTRDKKLSPGKRDRHLDIAKAMRKLINFREASPEIRQAKAPELLLSVRTLRPAYHQGWFREQIDLLIEG